MSWRGLSKPPPEGPIEVEVQLGDGDPKRYQFGSGNATTTKTSGEPYLPSAQAVTASLFDVGIFKDTLLPSATLHASLAVAAWGIGRATDRLEAKDYLWPTGQVLNAWYAAVGRRILNDGMPVQTAFKTLSWPERLILSGVTLWGGRLLYQVTTRSVKRGKDQAKYEVAKKEEGFWDTALFKIFLPEALFQVVISLPFTAPFRHRGTVLTGYHPWIQTFAVGLFTAGFALETLADYQLDAHREEGTTGLKKDGVWSIVRHPNYLGDILVHASFPILLYGSDMLAPIELLGPIANYIYFRYIGLGGVRENETGRERRYSQSDPVKMSDFEQSKKEKNSIWPNVDAVQNQWTRIVVGCGVAGVVVEQIWRQFH